MKQQTYQKVDNEVTVIQKLRTPTSTYVHTHTHTCTLIHFVLFRKCERKGINIHFRYNSFLAVPFLSSCNKPLLNSVSKVVRVAFVMFNIARLSFVSLTHSHTHTHSLVIVKGLQKRQENNSSNTESSDTQFARCGTELYCAMRPPWHSNVNPLHTYQHTRALPLNPFNDVLCLGSLSPLTSLTFKRTHVCDVKWAICTGRILV